MMRQLIVGAAVFVAVSENSPSNVWACGKMSQRQKCNAGEEHKMVPVDPEGCTIAEVAGGVINGEGFALLMSIAGRLKVLQIDTSGFLEIVEHKFFNDLDVVLSSIACSGSLCAATTDVGDVYVWGNLIGDSDGGDGRCENLWSTPPAILGQFRGRGVVVREIAVSDSLNDEKCLLALCGELLILRIVHT